MNLLAFISNAVLFLFTCFVVLTDGPADEFAYIVYGWLLLLVPIFSLVVIFRISKNTGWLSFHLKKKESEEERKTEYLSSNSTWMKIVAISGNIVLFGFSLWAFISQNPHPEEEGFIVFVVILFLTPILSAVAISLSRNNPAYANK